MMQQFIGIEELAGTKGSQIRPDHHAIDAKALEKDLRSALRGEVRFDPGSRALYATDASNYRQVPIGVVLPRSVEDVERTVALARRHGAPILSRGGGTSLAGQCCNVAVVMDWSKYLHRVLELDPERRRARVQPGLVLDDLRHMAEQHHLTFGPDPSTHNHCTLGGMIGNNSCGVHSVMAGETVDNVESLEVLTYDGLRLRVGSTDEAQYRRILQQGGRRAEIYRRLRGLRDRYGAEIRAHFPKIPRRVSGYNLPALLPENGFNVARALVGSESTCVTILEATLHLVPSPPVRCLAVLGYPDVYCAGDHIPDILRHSPIGLEGMDERLVEDMVKMRIHPKDVKLLPQGRGWLLVEFDERRGRRICQGHDGGARWSSASPQHEALRRSVSREHHLERAQIRPGRDGPCARPTTDLGRVGRFIRAGGAAGGLSPRAAQALRPVRVRLRPLWPFRPGLRPHSDRFRSGNGRRHQEIPIVPVRCR